MCQSDILDFLKNHSGRWFTMRQISEAMPESPSATFNALTRLKRSKLIRFKKERREYRVGGGMRSVCLYSFKEGKR